MEGFFAHRCQGFIEEGQQRIRRPVGRHDVELFERMVAEDDAAGWVGDNGQPDMLYPVGRVLPQKVEQVAERHGCMTVLLEDLQGLVRPELVLENGMDIGRLGQLSRLLVLDRSGVHDAARPGPDELLDRRRFLRVMTEKDELLRPERGDRPLQLVKRGRRQRCQHGGRVLIQEGFAGCCVRRRKRTDIKGLAGPAYTERPKRLDPHHHDMVRVSYRGCRFHQVHAGGKNTVKDTLFATAFRHIVLLDVDGHAETGVHEHRQIFVQ